MDTALFNISVLPKPSLGSDKIIAICDGNILDLTMQFNTSALNTIFTINEVFVNTPSAVNIPGAYQLIATNDSGCSDTAVVNLTVNSKPSLGADKKISICSGTAIDLTANFSTTGLNTTWTKGNVSVPNPRSITSSGIYILVATNDFTCADTAIVTLVDNQSPTVRVVNPEPVCAPSTVNLTLFAVTSGSTPGLSFSYWQDAAASVSVLNADKAVNGLYFIKGTDTNGCFNIKPVAAVVYALPIVSAGRDTVICNQTVAFLHGNAVSSQAGAIVYSWSPAPGLSTPGSATTIARPGTSTIYTLSATVNYGVCSLTASDVVQVRMQPPVPAFAGNDTTAIEGIPHQLQASGGVNYLWFPPGSLNNPAIANPLAKLTQDTKFTVRVTDFAGCAATDTIIITVYPNIRYNLPTAFSPNGDGLNDVFRPLPIGIISTEWFRIYNRYGNLMHEAVNSLQGWDGYLNGKIQEIGNYVWAIKGIGKDGRVIQMKGNVVLVR
ncbi:MAG: T9SS type B sorting domain-containing protein [Ferruginibacter sp.]